MSYELAKEMTKDKYRNVVILTLNKGLYKATPSIFPYTSTDILFTIIITYNLLCDDLADDLKIVYETWLSDLTENSSCKDQ